MQILRDLDDCIEYITRVFVKLESFTLYLFQNLICCLWKNKKKTKQKKKKKNVIWHRK